MEKSYILFNFFFHNLALKNPGIPKKELQKEILIKENPDQYKKCDKCNFIIDPSKNNKHCDICGCCCEGFGRPSLSLNFEMCWKRKYILL